MHLQSLSAMKREKFNLKIIKATNNSMYKNARNKKKIYIYFLTLTTEKSYLLFA